MKTKNKTYQFNAKSVSDTGVVSGVLNHFNNKDHAGDVTLKGAFLRSLQSLSSKGQYLVMLWQHDPDKPIGVWKNLRETDRGLEGDGHINLDIELGREAYSLAKQGALTGLSIGYWVVDEQYDSKTATNYLKEVELRETSLVTFPCNEESRINEVKNLKLGTNGLPTANDLKGHLIGTGMAAELAEAVIAKYLPDYISPEEQEAARVAAKAEIDALMQKHGLSLKDFSEEETEETEEASEEETEEATEEESKGEEATEEEDKEKSEDMDLTFFK